MGCGDGTYESLLETDFSYLVALDLTLSNLKIAKRHVKNRSKVDFILADARYLPFRKSSVDTVLCSEVMEHLYDPLKTLHELLHVSRNTLLLTVPVITAGRRLASIVQYNRRLQKIEADIGHVSLHNSRWWTSMIYRTIEGKQAKWRVEVNHLYISAEPFTPMFAHLRSETILRAIDKTLCILERALSHSMFANQLIIRLTVR